MNDSPLQRRKLLPGKGFSEKFTVSVFHGGSLSNQIEYEDALKMTLENGRASAALLQRLLRLGYGHAADLICRMQREGYVNADFEVIASVSGAVEGGEA